jgi:hypothetical protein
MADSQIRLFFSSIIQADSGEDNEELTDRD